MELEKLFKQIASNDKDAFDTLFREWYARLCRFACHFVNSIENAEEIVSDVFMSLWQNRYSLTEIQRADTYLFVAVRNRCYNHYRRQTILKVSIEEQNNMEDIQENPHEAIENRELLAKLNQLVEALPEQRRIIFQMVKEDGLTAKQAAEILNLSVRTVENQIFKAIKILEKEITNYLGYSPRQINNHQLRSVILSFL